MQGAGEADRWLMIIVRSAVLQLAAFQLPEAQHCPPTTLSHLNFSFTAAISHF